MRMLLLLHQQPRRVWCATLPALCSCCRFLYIRYQQLYHAINWPTERTVPLYEAAPKSPTAAHHFTNVKCASIPPGVSKKGSVRSSVQAFSIGSRKVTLGQVSLAAKGAMDNVIVKNSGVHIFCMLRRPSVGCAAVRDRHVFTAVHMQHKLVGWVRIREGTCKCSLKCPVWPCVCPFQQPEANTCLFARSTLFNLYNQPCPQLHSTHGTSTVR